MRISERARRVESSGIRRMFDLASQLKDPLDLSIGQPDFAPPEEAIAAAERAMRSGQNRYTVTQGLERLNELVLDHLEARAGRRPEASMITVGVAGGLTLSMLALLDPHERCLIPDPNFVCYRNLALMTGAGPAYYDMHDDFVIRDERLEAGLEEGVRAVIVNSPGNPTGKVISKEELTVAARFAERHDLAVISDEIYDLFAYDGPCPSMLEVKEDAIILGGFSKTYGMPGWRIGYAAGPKDIIEKMRTLQQFSFVCAPSPAQAGVLAALEAKVDLTPHVNDYRRKRDLVVEKLAPHFELVAPQGAFYAYPKAPGPSAGAFAESGIEERLLLVPGRAFSRRDTHFRISFALRDDRLVEALDALVRLKQTQVG